MSSIKSKIGQFHVVVVQKTPKKCMKKVWCTCEVVVLPSKTLFTWSGGPRSSGVGFFCFHALGDTKQKKPTPLDRSPPLHVNRV